MNKRGQFFLIAAIIIAVLVIGLAAVINTVVVGDSNEAFYDLADEVGSETKQVLDYGTFNFDTQEDLDNLTKGFLETYADYISQEEVLFIYGDASNIKALVFNDAKIGEVILNIGERTSNIVIQQRTGDEADVIHDDINNRITVDVRGIEYEFDLRQGQNFFFVIIKEQDDERFVARG